MQGLLKEKNSLHRTILQKEETVVSLKFDKECVENMLVIRKVKEDLTLRKETIRKEIEIKKSEIILLEDKTVETELREIKSKLEDQNQKVSICKI